MGGGQARTRADAAAAKALVLAVTAGWRRMPSLFAKQAVRRTAFSAQILSAICP
jgi:hypothetical protein